MIEFITRNEKGKLQQDLGYWDMFKDELFGMAKTEEELKFIGQLVEDLVHAYEDKLDEMGNQD